MKVKALQDWKSRSSVKSNECIYKGKTYKNSDDWGDGDCRRCLCQVKKLCGFLEIYNYYMFISNYYAKQGQNDKVKTGN